MGAVLHGQGSGDKRFFGDGLELATEAGLASCEKAETFEGGAADHVRWVVVEGHEQSGDALTLRRGLRDAGSDESQMRTRAPVVGFTCGEGVDQFFSVGREQFGLTLGDAAGGVGGALA